MAVVVTPTSVAHGYPGRMGFTADALRGGPGDRRAGGGIVDHRLARRMLINQVRLGRLRRDEVCDAHPELIRAAGNVGTETKTVCPICEESNLRIVTYVFGHHLPSHGRCVSTAKEMRRLAESDGGERTAYMVEACTECRWHHLLRVWTI
jgi:hypothetical protein